MKKGSFPLRLISSPEDFADEILLVEAMFRRGLEHFHLRKPRKDTRAMEKWLLDLDPEFRANVVVHGHSDLVLAFGLQGYHGNEEYTATKSTRGFSAHTFAELSNGNSFDYAFLSPIFDSFSKFDYPAAFSEEQILQGVANWKQFPNSPPLLFALGGIDASRLGQVKEWGFSGAAILGAVWNSADPIRSWDTLLEESYRIEDLDSPHYPPILSWRERLVVRRGDCR